MFDLTKPKNDNNLKFDIPKAKFLSNQTTSLGPRIDLLSNLRQQTSIPLKQPLQQESSTLDKIKAGDIKGLVKEVGIGLSHGLAKTGTVKQDIATVDILANSNLPAIAKFGESQQAKIKQQNDFLEANPVNSVPAMIGEEITNIPLWMAGEGAVSVAGKGLSKLAPTVTSKLGKLPNFVKGGLKDATTYGTVVAPVESIREGEDLQGLLEREKQLPGVLLGGTAIRGIGAGAKLGKDVAGKRIQSARVNTQPTTPTGNVSNLGETTDIDIPIVNGRADLGSVVETPRVRTMNADIESPNETLVLEPVRPNSNNQINQLTQGTSNKVVGAEPNIPEGLKERGVSKNIRTDANRPDELRDSFSADPLVYKQIGNKETLAKAQSIFNKGLEPAITELDILIKDLKPEAAPLVKMIADKLTLDGNIVRARELMSNAANRATESGQFGQAFRILRDADPETFLMTFDKMLKKLNKEGSETYGKNWEDFDLTPDELNLVNSIERGNQASYDSVFEQIQSRIANEMPATAMEKINAWRHMSMLLNPKTHIRNVVGNGIMMGMRKSAQRVSGVLQKVILPQEKRTQSVFVNKEYKDLANQYFEANKKDLLSGANKYQDNVSVTMPNKRVFRKSRIGEKLGKDIDILEKARKFNYELLQKGDNRFFRNAYADRLASYAQAKDIKDFSKLPQEAFDIAKLEAEQATYKDASDLATYLNKVKNPGKNASLGKKVKAGLTEAALPFTKTPINIIKRGIEYSPVGIINGLSKIKDAKTATTAIDNLAKGLTGTGILGLGYLLASKGILTGKAEKDADLKAYNTNTGNAPFSILGKYSYDWAQPFSIPLSVGVEIYNSRKSNPEDIAKLNSIIEKNDTTKFIQITKDVLNGVYDAIAASGDTVFNMSVLKGVKNLLANPNGVTEGIMQLPQSYATQFIPTVSNQLAGTIDPTVRQTYVKGNYPESTKNAILSRIPIASKTLEPKQTPFGEDVKRIENPITRTASQFFSPGIVAKDQNIDPEIDAELRRLNEYGFTKQFPTMVPNYIEKTQTHPKIELTPKETTEYQKRVGQLTLKSFDKVMNSSSYNNAKDSKKTNKTADEIKAELLAKAISEAKAQAKKEILKSKGFK